MDFKKTTVTSSLSITADFVTAMIATESPTFAAAHTAMTARAGKDR